MFTIWHILRRRPAEPVREVVVAGAGYAGLTAFLELQERAPLSVHLTLVSAAPYHTFITELHTLAAGEVEDERVRLDLKKVVRPPHRLVIDKVQVVVPQENKVVLSGQTLAYDFLVLALGSEPEYYGVPGAREHGHVLYDLASAQQLRARLQAQGEGRVAIVGGGLTGIEMAGEIAPRFSVTIVEGSPGIMPGFDPGLAAAARRILSEKGVTILTGTPVTRVEPGRLHLKDGRTVDFDLLVWSGGVRGKGLLARSGFAVGAKGRARVDEYLRAEGFPNVYIAGDAAACRDAVTCRDVPPTAQAAVQMGRSVARNLLRRLRGKPEEPFQPRLRGMFASLGPDTGVGHLGQEQFIGLPAIVVKRLIEAHHAYEAGGLLDVFKRIIPRPRRRLATAVAVRRNSLPEHIDA